MAKMIKAVSLLLAFCMIFSLCGCGSSGNAETIVEEEIVYVSDESSSANGTQSNTSGNNTQNNNQNTDTSSNNNNTQNNSTQNTEDNKKVKTIKVLAIGNSYSNNTTQYISRIADSTKGNTTVFAASLFFSGATLSQHIANIEQWNTLFDQYGLEETKKQYYSDAVPNSRKYEWLQVGDKNLRTVRSLYEAIRYEDWDYITIQQSPDGCDDFSTYEPYLIKLYDYIQAEYNRDDMNGKKCPPILVHQTWAFNNDMAKNNAYKYYPVNYKNNTEMFKKVEQAYNLAVQKIKEEKGVDAPMIKSGQAVELAQAKYGYARTASENLADNTLYADEISHLNKRGCYLTACVWIETLAKLAGVNIDTRTATFVPLVDGASAEDCQTLQYIAHSVVHGE
ncbi:MAG: DUF4886 domain-containing protein [Clostridia bacterium]|nr:DUF4886 domain-containing protein [Clostridia bacterium]